MRAVFRLDHMHFHPHAVKVEHLTWVVQDVFLRGLGQVRRPFDELVKLFWIDGVWMSG